MDIYVVGQAVHPGAPVIRDKRLEELAYETAHAALESAKVPRDSLDSVTLAASDELDGRSITSMLLAAPSGAYLKDELRVTDSGLMGLVMQALRLESGRFDLGLVISWNQTSVGPIEEAMRMRAEPFFLRPIGINGSLADALFAAAWCHEQGVAATIAAADERARERRAAAASSPRALAVADVNDEPIAWPLSRRHRAPVTDGSVAIVLASRRWCDSHPQHRPLARLSGASWCVDSYRLDRKRLVEMDAFHRAYAHLLKQTPGDVDVFESGAQDSFQDLAYCTALGHHHKRPPRVSPSGGAWAQNPYFCTGLLNAAEAVSQLSGRSGKAQVPGVRRAVAHGQHGLAAQGHVFAMFEEVPA